MRTADARAERLAELVMSALPCGAEERGALLDRECENDPELRAEIESLLREEAGVDLFLETPAVHLAAESFVRAGAFQAGQRIGHYEIVAFLGSGGMGEVYLAEDRELHRKVALKLVRRAMASEEMLHHFKREEHLLASLNHPNIALLYGGGVTPDGIPFFAMEYVEGEQLDRSCDERGLGVKERLLLFRKVCAAVTYAHQHLVIHRDLKPANIRVTPEGEPKLLDFGIAKLLDSDDEAASGDALTLQGVMTPEYASPEQVARKSITTASDVYSLGVILYRLLTGQSPYRTSTNRPHEIAQAIAEQEPMRPSAMRKEGGKAEARRIKFLEGDLDNIVLRAMRKEPARRYSSVGQFSEDIRRHLEGLPVLARPDTVFYRTSKFVTRHRVVVAAVMLVALSLLGGMVATLLQVRTARRERAKAEAISAFLQRTLAASNPQNNLSGQRSVKDLLDDASRRVATAALSDQPELKAELQRIIGQSYLALGEYDLADQNLAAALDMQVRMYGEDNPETLKTLVSLASLWAGATGKYGKASEFYREKLPLLRSAQRKGTLGPDYLIEALGGDALLQRAEGNSKAAEGLLEEAAVLRARAYPEVRNNPDDALLALTKTDQGKFAEAINTVRERIVALRQGAGDETPELCANLTGLGSFLIEVGAFAEAEENLRAAETIYRRLFSVSNMQLGDNLRLQAQALLALQDYGEAEARIDDALKIYRAAASPRYINFPTALMVQGMICGRTGRTSDAERLLREAVRLRTENVPETHFLRATANGALGEFLTAEERYEEAEPFLLVSYRNLRDSQAPGSPRTRLALERLVTLYDGWGRAAAAVDYRNRLAEGKF